MILLAACAGPSAAQTEPLQRPAQGGASAAGSESVWSGDLPAERPRFSPDGNALVFAAGERGQRDIYVLELAEGKSPVVLVNSDADDADPTWSRDGSMIVFSSNRDGDYDLYQVPAFEAESGKEPERLTNIDGDERQPTVSPIQFTFEAVRHDYCTQSGTSTQVLDTYDKIAFTWERPDTTETASEIWFTSPDGVHRGRLSAEGAHCSQPSWMDGGLQLVWECAAEADPNVDGGLQVMHGNALWTRDLAAALEAAGATEDALNEGDDMGCAFWDGYWRDDECMTELDRQYTGFPGEAQSPAADGLASPTGSANRTVMLAAGPPGGNALFHRTVPVPGMDDDGWYGLDVGVNSPANPDWSPDGKSVAFDGVDENGVRRIYLAQTDFYLQSARNLIDYPELLGTDQSSILNESGLVARPGTEKEFFEAYEKIRYQDRPQLITVDAALQAYRDEFVGLLRDAEERAQENLRKLVTALSEHYLQKLEAGNASDTERFLAVYFTVPRVILEAYSQVPGPRGEDWMIQQSGNAEDWLDEDEVEAYRERMKPVSERIDGALEMTLASVPDVIRDDVSKRVEASMAHAGVEKIEVPGYPKPTNVDFSQFKVRGHYEELPGYFIAISWLSHVPLPLDESLLELARLTSDLNAHPDTAGLYSDLDSLMGAFMGRPVDATMQDVLVVYESQPESFAPFDRDALAEALEKLRGDMPIRGTEGAVEGGEYPLRVSLFPKRLGKDVVMISKLTHPSVGGRPFPAAMDILAGLGLERALDHAIAAEAKEQWADDYAAALQKLGQDTLLEPTDIYHVWLATLLTLAKGSDLPENTNIRFVGTEAWADRLLTTALAGYTQLKHSSVLYAMQESGIECDGSSPVMLLVEQPVLPMPRGFVEPHPTFFRELSTLAQQVYQDLGAGEEPRITEWYPLDENNYDAVLNAANWSATLADIADKQIAGEPLTEQEALWIARTGARLEAMFMGAYEAEIFAGGKARIERGVKIATDIYTNVQRGQVRALGVGPLLDLYAAVPEANGVGERIAQGVMLSFYEFEAPMSDRPTDEKWHQQVEKGELPALPAWMSSFAESGQ